MRLFMKHEESSRTSADFTYTSEQQFIIAECIQKSCPVLQKLKTNPELPKEIPAFSREADLA
jgi:hypothetical protein